MTCSPSRQSCLRRVLDCDQKAAPPPATDCSCKPNISGTTALPARASPRAMKDPDHAGPQHFANADAPAHSAAPLASLFACESRDHRAHYPPTNPTHACGTSRPADNRAPAAIMKKMPYPFRFAMCNEAFERRPFTEVCRTLRTVGYTGIELAPFTLGDDPLALRAAQRRELRDIIVGEGLDFVGLHWLLVVPFPIHVTTPDLALRERSWQYVRGLIDLCADLSPDGGADDSHGIMVFGSPKQRSSTGGITAAQAVRNYVAGLAGIAGHAEDRGVTILVEALPHSQSDVIHTLEEAVAVVREINSPAVKTMFDTHNAEDETEPHAQLIESHYDLIRHIHLNEMNGGHPGTANYDFAPIFAILRKLAYKGWVSVEAFDFAAGAETIASESLEHMKKAASASGRLSE